MRFVRRVVADAFRLLAAAPADLIVAVAALYLVGAVLSMSRTLGIVGLVLDFAGSTLLAAGLLGRPTPDGLPAAAARLGRRLGPAVSQVLIVMLGVIGLAIAIAIVLAIVASIVAPGFLANLAAVSEDPRTPLHPLTAASLLAMTVAVVVITGRLLPSAGLVLDREVGAFESLRLSWASTRGRTIACAVLFLLVTAPSYIFFLFLPPDVATFFSIFAIVAAVATGVAAYRILFVDGAPDPRAGDEPRG